MNTKPSTPTPALYSEAITRFLKADIAGALQALDVGELDAELAQAEKVRHKADEAVRQNADSRLFRAEMLALEGRFAEARQSAEAALKLYDFLVRGDAGRYSVSLAWGFEGAGSVCYAAGQIDSALDYFAKGLECSGRVRERENQGILLLHAALLQNVGACCYRLGDNAGALSDLEKAVSLFTVIQELQRCLGTISPFVRRRHAAALSNLGTAYTKAHRSHGGVRR
jgi:tetratricopeptide (TPR) repeat protein